MLRHSALHMWSGIPSAMQGAERLRTPVHLQVSQASAAARAAVAAAGGSVTTVYYNKLGVPLGRFSISAVPSHAPLCCGRERREQVVPACCHAAACSRHVPCTSVSLEQSLCPVTWPQRGSQMSAAAGSVGSLSAG